MLGLGSEPLSWLGAEVRYEFGDGIYYDVNPYLGCKKGLEMGFVLKRFNYQVSRPLSLRLITDYDDYYRTLYMSALLSYEYRPGTVFYFGVDDSQERDLQGFLRGTGRYFFVKRSYRWRV